MKNLTAIVLLVLAAGCGDITEVAATGNDAGDPGTGGGAGVQVGAGGSSGVAGASQGGAGGDSSQTDPDGGIGGSGGQGSSGLGGTGSGASGAGGNSSQSCPPSADPCPAGTTCYLSAPGNGICVCPGYPDVAWCAPSGQVGACVDLRSDVKNCGTCRRACGPGQSCQTGVCR